MFIILYSCNYAYLLYILCFDFISEDPVGQQCRYALDKLASLLEPPKQFFNLMELWDKPDSTHNVICHLKDLKKKLENIDFSIVPNCDQLVNIKHIEFIFCKV